VGERGRRYALVIVGIQHNIIMKRRLLLGMWLSLGLGYIFHPPFARYVVPSPPMTTFNDETSENGFISADRSVFVEQCDPNGQQGVLPILFFVNGKSGGGRGKRLRSLLEFAVGPQQVVAFVFILMCR
jgi:hypothetical protein